MKVIIRTDSSFLIGSGHVMRCLVLADLLNIAGHTVSFICRDLPGNFNKYIVERGYAIAILPLSDKEKKKYLKIELVDDYELWRGVALKTDSQETRNALIDKKVGLLVVDHYGIDCVWHKQLRDCVDKIMVVDDLANRQHDCDVLLDHNFYIGLEKRYDNLVPKKCKKLLGPGYALINPKLKAVLEHRKHSGKLDKNNTIKNILVFLGGVDGEDYTDRILAQVLVIKRFESCVFNVVLGSNNPNKSALKKKYCEYDNVVFHVQPDYYHALMEKADLAIGAGGVSQLERSYIKIPSFVQAVAENQKKIVKEMRLYGYIQSIESLSELGDKNLNFNELECHILSISELFNDNKNTELSSRLVNEKDMKDIYEWRIHPSIVSVSASKQAFSFSEHRAWFLEKLQSDDSYFLMFECLGFKVGVIRFDIKGRKLAVVNIFLNPLYINQGYGKKILKYGLSEFFKNTTITEVRADILEENIKSKRIFIRCGFNKYKESYCLHK
ncbi:UDP-2,4-diacetamido-2,4,6-trideoxy-beta-L-altropyranose hydrolase [Piscirickettsia salmonis]|uniref:Acetyltransferase domain protein n=1 Tax=Piscirickettsia salmonis TaxID=1238 RepID=A0A1L6TGS3_PISSA|nr:UDP-2,4-diacetamido-2,4,6-trideoxy-beta-L-altropyranose hydrolase [Piscirickettsia salmonis]AKP72997.1 UDP-2,4-diacetamido-2,4,6-trideoxy-beta-L-altropyranose hydrolase [Piscirickettsia salmonis LF-89 = ATCC VR-1361]ALB21632.1 acetyltransferase domain protein [Piscirickettsia salmonis]ALY01837.1 UDP-2,4-diacetamido-2,4,6-trideoxy-beta-L-altropyranose hydrolase [Piscirickettsia salmonis]AMA41346.1 UDP-2,4-diacetamido-2,4,6-trideoxy-beta-L-altropyranose hydrolase [Piscirickettsia salmonis]AOS